MTGIDIYGQISHPMHVTDALIQTWPRKGAEPSNYPDIDGPASDTGD